MERSQKKEKKTKKKNKMSPYPSSGVWKNHQSNLSQKGKLKLFFLSLSQNVHRSLADRISAIVRVAAAPLNEILPHIKTPKRSVS